MDETDYYAPSGNDYGQQWKALSGWFLGPRAENKDVFKKIFNELLDKHAEVRQAFFPTDPAYITPDMIASEEYAAEVDDLRTTLHKMSDELKQSVPFFTPRYQAHMLWDVTMPSLLGYMMAMFHCQNNVDTAASSVTTLYEKAVGLQLCDMLGYSIEKPKDAKDAPRAWGHITCGGSVANIEAVWASRNIKFSAVGLLDAVKRARPEILSKIEKKKALSYNVHVLVKPPTGDEYVMTPKPLGDCTTRELLNMDIDEFCNLTKRVAEHAGLKGHKLDDFAAFVEKKSYTSKGDRKFMTKHGIKPAVYTVPANCHYSWPKAGTLLGLGSKALVPIPLDDDFRQDIKALKTILIEKILNEVPILSATAVIGSTEESAVDPIYEMWVLREELKKTYGVNFALLADGAWGGYMKTMIIGTPKKEKTSYKPHFVPFMALTPYVERQYKNIQLADTITIDPHKSGFCPYPAGALCYRNGAMRYFIAFLHPEVYHGEDDPTMGVYGIEGSKPGAAPAGVLASHKVIGLDVYGYGRILGQCQTTCKIFYCLWLTLARPNDPYICLPIQRLPEKYRTPFGNTKMTYGEYLIKNFIIGKSMAEVYDHPEVMAMLKEVGPDTLINTFVVNMKNKDGTINSDVQKANALQKALSDALNVYVGKCNERVPIILMQSGLNKNHGNALKNFKARLHLDQDDETLNVMVNTAMNPWQWNESISVLGDIFRTQILNCLGSITDDANQQHVFVVSGDPNEDHEIFAEYIPDFNIPSRQYHLVLKLQASPHSKHLKRGRCIRSVKKRIHDIVNDTEGSTYEVFDITSGTEKAVGTANLTVVDMPHFNHFDIAYGEYMEKQTYLLYGDQGRTYMSHCMKKQPDFMHVVELSAPPYGLTEDLITLGVKVTIPELAGGPKFINKEVVDPLDNNSYTINYKGREYADCQSSISLNSCVFFKQL